MQMPIKLVRGFNFYFYQLDRPALKKLQSCNCFNIVRKGKFYAFLRNFDIVATLLLNPIILIFLLILITIV